MTSRISQMTLMLFAVVAGCAGETQPGQTSDAIRAEELPQVAGCDSVATYQRVLRVRPVAGIDDLFVVLSADHALCIDSLDGVQAMMVRFDLHRHGGLDEAGSNPMPGDNSTNGEASSNPMPGDPGNTNAGSNPMPGQDHKH